MRIVRRLLAESQASGQYGLLTIEQHSYQRRAFVDMMLARATMGLRLSERLKLTSGQVSCDSEGLVMVEVMPSRSKTKRGAGQARSIPRSVGRCRRGCSRAARAWDPTTMCSTRP